jgi:hypothetical protein
MKDRGIVQIVRRFVCVRFRSLFSFIPYDVSYDIINMIRPKVKFPCYPQNAYLAYD